MFCLIVPHAKKTAHQAWLAKEDAARGVRWNAGREPTSHCPACLGPRAAGDPPSSSFPPPLNVAAARTAGDASGGPACGRARWSAALCTIPPPRLAHCALCLISWTRQTGSRAKDTLPGSSARSWWLRTHPLHGLLRGRKPPAGQVQPGTARGESGVSRHKGWGRVGGAGWGSSGEEERAGRTAIASTFASCPETSRGWRLGRQAKQLWPHIFVGNFPQTRVRWPLALTCPSLGEGRGGVFLGRGRESVCTCHWRALVLDSEA